MLISAEYRVVLGAAATLMAVAGYLPYFRDLLSGRTRPHAFTWLVWGVLTAIAFGGQVTNRGGPGAWVTGFTAAVSFVIFLAALRQGDRNIVPVDWLCLAGAAVALALWAVTDRPLLAVILITVIDALGFLPTIRKSDVPQVLVATRPGDRFDLHAQWAEVRPVDPRAGQSRRRHVALPRVAGAHERPVRGDAAGTPSRAAAAGAPARGSRALKRFGGPSAGPGRAVRRRMAPSTPHGQRVDSARRARR
jgi:hypothetical protein